VSDSLVINVCRLIRDFPSISEAEHSLSSFKKEAKVGYVQYGLAPGICSLMREQVTLGAYMYVIAARRRGIPNFEVNNGIRVYRVSRPYDVTAVLKMRKLGEIDRIDIVHAHATSGFAYALLKRIMKKPYVIHVHGTTAGVKNSLKRFLLGIPRNSLERKFWNWLSLKRQEFMWKKADVLIAVSRNIVDELVCFYHVSRDKVKLVHNGVDTNFFKPVSYDFKMEARVKLGISGDPVILYVGHLGIRKGLQFLIRAVPKIVERFPLAKFVLLGGTPSFLGKRDYRQVWSELTGKLGVSKNIVFAGEVRHRNVREYYAAADVFVFPTLYEGLAKALLEAMACGLPVVATNTGGNPDVITDGNNGLLVEPGDVEGLASALTSLLLSPRLAKKLGKNARDTVKKHFTWRIAAEKIMGVYEELLGD